MSKKQKKAGIFINVFLACFEWFEGVLGVPGGSYIPNGDIWTQQDMD